MSALTDDQRNILAASRAGNVSLLEALLESCPNALTSWPAVEDSPLHEAAEYGNGEVCQALINAGAPIDAVDHTYQTPIFLAIRAFEEVPARLLLKAGASTDHEDIRNDTPLHECARVNFGVVAEMLIEHGAKLDAKNTDDETPLHIAASDASPALCRLFVEHGADPNAASRGFMTPLWIASKNGRPAVCDALIQCGSSMSGSANCPSPFLQACLIEDIAVSAEVMAIFLKHGADPHELDIYGLAKARTSDNPGALQLCVLNDSAPGLELLAQAGMQLEQQLFGGSDLLQLAAKQNATEAAAKLIELGLAPDEDCQQVAKSSGHTEILALFQAYEARAAIQRIAATKDLRGSSVS